MKRKKHHHHNVDQIMESSSKVVGTKTRLGGFSSDYILLDFTPKTRKNPFAQTLLDFPKKQEQCKNLPKILKKSLSFSSGFSPKNLNIKNNCGSKKIAKSTNFDVKARRKSFFYNIRSPPVHFIILLPLGPLPIYTKASANKTENFYDEAFYLAMSLL